MTPGFYTSAQLSNADYHGGPGISNSGLKMIGERTPAHYWHSSPMNPNRRPSKDTRPKFIGTALHAACLEPEKFASEYVVAEFKARNEAGYKAWAAKQSKLILMESEHDNVIGMRAALHAHQEAAALLRDAYEFEYSAYAQDPETGVLVRMRMDLMTQGGWIVDLKKTQDASDDAIARTIATYKYYHQDAFYTDCTEWACGVPPERFAFVFIEEEPPHCVAVKVLASEDRQRGRELYRRNLNTYAKCLTANQWPGYSQSIDVVDLPQYERARIDRFLCTP